MSGMVYFSKTVLLNHFEFFSYTCNHSVFLYFHFSLIWIHSCRNKTIGSFSMFLLLYLCLTRLFRIDSANFGVLGTEVFSNIIVSCYLWNESTLWYYLKMWLNAWYIGAVDLAFPTNSLLIFLRLVFPLGFLDYEVLITSVFTTSSSPAVLVPLS